MSLSHTNIFPLKKASDSEIKKTLKSVYHILQQENYQGIDQIVGYLLTGEPIYITSKQGARSAIRHLDRSQIIATILNEYLK